MWPFWELNRNCPYVYSIEQHRITNINPTTSCELKYPRGGLEVAITNTTYLTQMPIAVIKISEEIFSYW